MTFDRVRRPDHSSLPISGDGSASWADYHAEMDAVPQRKRTALVVEDIAEVRGWLERVLVEAFGAIEISTASDLRSARAWLNRSPEGEGLVALVDLGLPDGSGVDFIREMRAKSPSAQIIVTTIYEDDVHLVEAMAAGAHGYLLKDRDAKELVEQLRKVERQEPAISPSIARRILDQFRTHAVFISGGDRRGEALTPRETEVLQLIGRGLRSTEVATVLHLSSQTVSTHVKNIYRKLGIASRAEAALEASRRNLT